MQIVVRYRASRWLKSCENARGHPNRIRVSSSINLSPGPRFVVSEHLSVGGSNALATLPPGESPKYRIAGPKLRIMDKQIRDLDGVLAKLVRLGPFTPLRTPPL